MREDCSKFHCGSNYFALFVGVGANNSFKSYDVRRDGSDSFSWTATTGSLAAAVPDDGTCRRQRISGPILGDALKSPDVRLCREFSKVRTEAYNCATYFEEPWEVGFGYIAKYPDVNETGEECGTTCGMLP